MLEGWEWLIIGVVAIVIIMWGPSKIPEFAKAIGRAKGEFNKASQEVKEAATPTQTTQTNDEILLETAKNLGISPVGKNREQLAEEINQKIRI